MCVITGYGDGATGYLGAVAGNGLGKFSKLEKHTLKSIYTEENFNLHWQRIIRHSAWCQRQPASKLPLTELLIFSQDGLFLCCCYFCVSL